MSEPLRLIPFERTWDAYQVEKDPALIELVQQGKVPPDIALRLLTLGEWQPDFETPDPSPWRDDFQHLYVSVLNDIIKADGNPDATRPITQAVVWGPPPDTINDLAHNLPELYSELPTLYWSKRQLADIIKLRRAEEGKTITHTPGNSWFTAEELERHRCSGLAQPIWRVLVNRLNPDITNNFKWFYPAGWISFNTAHDISDRRRKRGAIATTRIKDEALYDLYNEIDSIGMKGIGPVGKLDLAAMLAPEHPDIMIKMAKAAGISIELATDLE